jgi:hypothetical protein
VGGVGELAHGIPARAAPHGGTGEDEGARGGVEEGEDLGEEGIVHGRCHPLTLALSPKGEKDLDISLSPPGRG